MYQHRIVLQEIQVRSIITSSYSKFDIPIKPTLDPITGGSGAHAELIRSDSGLLVGIRVSWSWPSSDPVECFKSPEVQLVHVPPIGSPIQRPLHSRSRNNSIEFNTTDLECNQMYLSRVRATLSDIRKFENGNEIFFGGIIVLYYSYQF